MKLEAMPLRAYLFSSKFDSMHVMISVLPIPNVRHKSWFGPKIARDKQRRKHAVEAHARRIRLLNAYARIDMLLFTTQRSNISVLTYLCQISYIHMMEICQ